jgi:tRNA threonylcarbamoyladenosine biosynthesis protein TsaB
MILLAADTSGKVGSIALARVPDDLAGAGSAVALEILEVVPLEGGTFSAQLVPQIADLLTKHGLSKRDIGGFAVASGPGSFTGLRVGLAAIKALAEILDKPIAAVSLLEAVAQSGESRGRVFAVLEAGRGEVYAGEYEVGAHVRMLSERLVSREEVLVAAAGAIVLSPDAGVIAAARAAGVRVEQVAQARSDLVARLGWEKIRAGDTIAPGELEANYIRRSDAEIFGKSD